MSEWRSSAPRRIVSGRRDPVEIRERRDLFAGKLNLIELREAIGRARLFVGPDSGPMHIAASTSTPIVALFGPNLPEYNAPWRAQATIIERTLDCRPCKQRTCATGDLSCLRSITVEEVFEACRSSLQA
jgi:ADP-heptose:LPS heptosyltransferase